MAFATAHEVAPSQGPTGDSVREASEPVSPSNLMFEYITPARSISSKVRKVG